MIEDIKADAQDRMKKSIAALEAALARIRTGRAHPDLLDTIVVSYYGNDTPLKQVASISVEDGRTLLISPWEKPLVPVIEKAILKSDLGLNPSTSGNAIRLVLPALTEDGRKELTRIARGEAEQARVSVRSVRRDSNAMFKDLVKDKDISEDDERRAQEAIQKLTDEFVAKVDATLAAKEKDLMAI